ncbi:hypothetical protein [Moraxella equi]|uniref:Uncharacterized protein n=1 Tax=Moraxella equi TaxID=60442 RepID=A0A378QWF3_9GAMM|nr:Uncharacterised protein [Moraxella equi]
MAHHQKNLKFIKSPFKKQKICQTEVWQIFWFSVYFLDCDNTEPAKDFVLSLNLELFRTFDAFVSKLSLVTLFEFDRDNAEPANVLEI